MWELICSNITIIDLNIGLICEADGISTYAFLQQIDTIRIILENVKLIY
jgi:hypothetical protein